MVELHMLTGWAERRPFHLITENMTAKERSTRTACKAGRAAGTATRQMNDVPASCLSFIWRVVVPEPPLRGAASSAFQVRLTSRWLGDSVADKRIQAS